MGFKTSWLWRIRLLLVVGPIFALWASTFCHYPFWWWWLPEERRLCEEVPIRSEKPEINCFYVMRHRIMPFRIEILHRKPDLARIDNLVPDGAQREALNQFITHSSRPATKTILTNTELERKILRSTSFRENIIMQNMHKRDIPASASLYSLFELVSGLTTEGMDGSVVLTSYDPPGHVVPHHDAFGYINGFRLATFMVYLQSPAIGGATVFPALRLGVEPKAGDAIFWFNVFQDGVADWQMTHAGCPVFEGRKSVAIFRVPMLMQEFTLPCTTDGEYFKTF